MMDVSDILEVYVDDYGICTMRSEEETMYRLIIFWWVTVNWIRNPPTNKRRNYHTEGNQKTWLPRETLLVRSLEDL